MGEQQRIEFEKKVVETARTAFPGPNYLTWLQHFHARLSPARYLEVGVASGGSLAFAGKATQAIGIDPAFNLTTTIEAPSRVYRLPSDEFFDRYDLNEIWGGPVDLAFIDGLHTFDQTFKDIMNITKYCAPGSVLLVHDVAPVHEVVARRQRATSFWTGDVWKIGPMIATLLPEVKMLTIATYPSGLMVLGNIAGQRLDPIAWMEQEARLMEKPFPKTKSELWQLVNVQAVTPNEVFDWLGV